jgi:hypothetical protein
MTKGGKVSLEDLADYKPIDLEEDDLLGIFSEMISKQCVKLKIKKKKNK